MKKLVFYLIGALIVIAGFLFLQTYIQKKQLMSHPYPYVLKHTVDQKELASAQEAHILLIGDKMGNALAHYIPYINNKLSKNLKSPLKIYNWCQKNESVVRTLHKIKSLKKIPPMVIYHGSADEFYEKIFEVDDYTNIQKNIKRFNNSNIQTILELVPIMSKFIFKPTNIVVLKNLEADTRSYTDIEQQRRMEITYSMYKYHLLEVIKIIRQSDSEIILLTTPLNYSVAPRAVCSNSTTSTLSSHLVKLESYIEEHKNKNAYAQLKELAKNASTNAQVYYLLGRTSFMLGKTKEAALSFDLATSFDCVPWRSNAVFNSIIEQSALSNRLKLIDFNAHVNNSLERRVLFSDVFFPQTIFYEEISEKLIVLIKEFFQI